MNVIPINDLDLLSDAEKRKLLEEYAINYPLGLFFLKIGLALLIPILFFYTYSFIRNKLAKRKSF